MTSNTMRILVAAVPFLIALSLCAPASARIHDMECRPSGGSDFWVRRLVTDQKTDTVRIEFQRSAGGPLEVETGNLTYADDGEINGYPAFGFRQGAAPNHVNLFKLFDLSDEWRLIEVGIIYVDGEPTLQALGKSTAFACKRR